MNSGSENNALVEIALALSMAFFSLMILTMVSMGVGKADQQNVSKSVIKIPEGLSLKKPDPSKSVNSEDGQSSAIEPEKLAVYYKEKFYDAGLEPLTAPQIQTKKIKFLAVEPDLSLRQAIAIKVRFGETDVVVTTLNEAWLKTLKEKFYESSN